MGELFTFYLDNDPRAECGATSMENVKINIITYILLKCIRCLN